MTVRELIEILEDLDPDARVYIMSQQRWPFEVAIHGVTVRAEFTEADEDVHAEGAHRVPAARDHERWLAAPGSLPETDVFIVEGRQLRYGSKGAWDTACRG